MIHLLIRKEKEIKIHSIISHSENNNATKYLGGAGPPGPTPCTTGLRSDTGSHNRLDLIQSIVPTHYVCSWYAG